MQCVLYGTAKRYTRCLCPCPTRRRPSSTASTTSSTAWHCTTVSCTGPIRSSAASLHWISVHHHADTKFLLLGSTNRERSSSLTGALKSEFTVNFYYHRHHHHLHHHHQHHPCRPHRRRHYRRCRSRRHYLLHISSMHY